jgi:protein-disulfide isomerase
LEGERRKAALAELLVKLRKSEPALRINLDPPRRTVDVGPEDPSEGPATAPVTIVEFADFQCPFCGQLAPTLRRIREQYGDRVRLIWKDFPLAQIHPRASQAAEAARCASDQGRFWDYHDRLFTNQRALETSALKQYAKDVGAETARFATCLDSGKYAETVRLASSAASRLGLTSTPTTFVNGRMVSGAKPYATFAAIIDDELAR